MHSCWEQARLILQLICTSFSLPQEKTAKKERDLSPGSLCWPLLTHFRDSWVSIPLKTLGFSVGNFPSEKQWCTNSFERYLLSPLLWPQAITLWSNLHEYFGGAEKKPSLVNRREKVLQKFNLRMLINSLIHQPSFQLIKETRKTAAEQAEVFRESLGKLQLIFYSQVLQCREIYNYISLW